MELLLIDVNSIQKISDWVDMWSVKRYGNKGNIEIINGKKRINPAWFYGNDERYIYTQNIKHNEVHATIEHVRELLLKIRNINIRLSDEGQSRHLTFEEREKLKLERQAFYDEYTLIVERTGGEQAETLIDKTKLEELFIPVFSDVDYIKDQTDTSGKYKCFNVFCTNLKDVLFEKPTDLELCEIAYMIHTSKYAKPKYRKKRDGAKGNFPDVLNIFCGAIGNKKIYRRPSQCENPSDELKQKFDML